jgi:HPt (histidine-containing phosphotransfer) domain-containing protein
MDDYISKPIAMPALVAALKKWMPAPRAVEKSAGHIATIDERAIKDTFGDDDAVFKEIMQSFLAPSETIIAEIVAAWEKRSAPDVKDAAHKLKSSARTIGAHALADICAALEAAGKASDWTAIDTLAPQARDEFGGVARYIEKL